MSDDDVKIYISDDSENFELPSRPQQFTRKRTRASSSANIPKPINVAKLDDPSVSRESDGDDDEPDWVRNFSPSQGGDEGRDRQLYSAFDDDDDSIIDLLNDKDDKIKEDVSDDNKQSAKDTDENELEDTKSNINVTKGKKPTKTPTSATKANISAPGMKNSLPLVAASKLEDSLVLLQGVGEELDLSGDVGAVGRVKITNGALYVDMKGGVFRTHTYASNTIAVVSIADDEARITTVLEEAVTLQCERNLFESDQLIKGHLEDPMNQENQTDIVPIGEDPEEAIVPDNHRKLDEPDGASGTGSTLGKNRPVSKRPRSSRGSTASVRRKSVSKPPKKKN